MNTEKASLLPQQLFEIETPERVRAMTLRVTPAMQAGISDHIWTLGEIAKLAD